jgi:hypothetical protein
VGDGPCSLGLDAHVRDHREEEGEIVVVNELIRFRVRRELGELVGLQLPAKASP